MIPYDSIKETVAKGLSDYLGIKIIRGNQIEQAPALPYGTYNVTMIAGANRGTWQEHEDGKDRKQVRSVWSFSFIAKEWDQSVGYAIKARGWFDHSGRALLSEKGITVQSTTDVTNRDNVLTVEYERKNGFDVVFYVYDEVESIASVNGHIESAEFTHERTN